MTTPSKPDLVALADRRRALHCLSNGEWMDDESRVIDQALRHLASQSSSYEAGQREAARRILDKISDLAAEIEVTTGRFDPSQWKIEVPVTDLQAVAAAISALPADGERPLSQDEHEAVQGALIASSELAHDIQSSDGGGGSRPALKKERIETTTVHEDRTTSLAAVRQVAGVAPGPSEATPSTAGSVREHRLTVNCGGAA